MGLLPEKWLFQHKLYILIDTFRYKTGVSGGPGGYCLDCWVRVARCRVCDYSLQYYMTWGWDTWEASDTHHRHESAHVAASHVWWAEPLTQKCPVAPTTHDLQDTGVRISQSFREPPNTYAYYLMGKRLDRR